MKSQIIGSAIVFLLSVATGNTWASVQYTVTDLGTLGGTSSAAHGINNSGEVVGSAQLSNNHGHTFSYCGNGPMQDIDPQAIVGGGAWDINDRGDIVGGGAVVSSSVIAFFYKDGVRYDLGTLGGMASQAFAVNNNRQVVGWAYPSGSFEERAFISNDCVPMQDLGIFDGGSMSWACDINDSGQVIGVADTSLNRRHAFLWNGSGSLQDINPVGATTSTASAINNAGEIVGGAQFGGGFTHAFLYRGSGPAIDLGTLGGKASVGYDVNENGQVVGYAHTASDVAHAFLFNGGGAMHDLNDLIDPLCGWTLTHARAINDSGQIVGYGINPSGQDRAFLLTPIPEPSALILLGVGAASLLTCPWRHRRT